jgi:predicted AlkP superfamily pyrophosphatase or phosphodiesterase
MTPALLRRAVIVLALLLPLPAYAADLLILISIDGFRADYLERGLTPTLARFAETGLRAKAMEPAFPSVTFPNHYSIVTGLLPDHHGIINNTMRDPAMPGHTFRLTDRAELTNPAWWDGGVPIWETLRRQHLKSGAVFWPGTEVAIHGVQPDYWRPYESKLSVSERVDAVLKLASLPLEQRPLFITLYFDAVDHQGHVAGPDSTQVNNALKEVDSGLARLDQGLQERQLLAHTNLVIVSDHGMA